MSVVCVFRCGLTRGMLSGERALALIFMIMTDGLAKIVSNWTVLTVLGDRTEPLAGDEAQPVVGALRRNQLSACSARLRGMAGPRTSRKGDWEE